MRAKFLRTVSFVAGIFVISTMVTASSSPPSETKTYKYDALGRLIEVRSTGSVNNNVKTTYEYDKAGNRKKKTKTGA